MPRQKQHEITLPSRESILHHLATIGVPLNLQALGEGLKIPKQHYLTLRRRLRAMERDGQLIRTRRGGYGLPAKMDLYKGHVFAQRDGSGRFIPDAAGEEAYLSHRQMRSLIHGDKVLVSINKTKQGEDEATLVEVLERNTNEVVGRFFINRGIGNVEPTNRRIHQTLFIPPDEFGEAEDGKIVVAQILEPPTKNQAAVGRVIEVLGDNLTPGLETEIVIRDYNLPRVWPQEVVKAVEKLPTEVPDSAKQGREDLRDTPLVTIDGEDARDFDDAVFCEPHGKGWRLIVAIADVASYVKPGTALDEEAHKRGTSVYFPTRVIPMLPEELSNGLCSLNPNVDRLCMACEMFITSHGTVRKFRFMNGVMRSAARLTYTEVGKLLAGEANEVPKLLHKHLNHLYQLYQLFREKRAKRGAIDFESTETRVIFGQDKKIERIVPTARNDAHILIEEMMLAANVSAAKFLEEQELPMLYRDHEGPGSEKLTQVRDFLKPLGLQLGGKDQPQAKHYAKLVTQFSDRPDRRLLQMVLLRSLKMAVYSPENTGHFGMAYESYTLFNSPIRRYPDLLIHRAIKHAIQNKSAQKFQY
ncbi:MAG: ribonuclease R, partial [Pseudomonadota bacterium]